MARCEPELSAEMMNIENATELFSGMLNPFLFLAIGFYWLALSPRLLGSWFLMTGGCLLFLNEALAYYEQTHLTSTSWVATHSYVVSTATAPLLLAMGVLLVVRSELAASR